MENTLKKQNQIIKTEVLAGCTTFVASVYIIMYFFIINRILKLLTY